jgi:hypothetical protein
MSMTEHGFEGEQALGGDDDFRAAFGEGLSATLDIGAWATGLDVERDLARIRAEVAGAVDQEERLRAIVRNEVLPKLPRGPKAPPEAGVYRALPDELAAVQEGLLFPGQVEAVNGVSSSHDSLPIGITQIGIAAVGYAGTSGTFSQRLFRKDVSARGADAFKEAAGFIDARQGRAWASEAGDLPRMARRGIRTYAERAILMDKVTAEWRMGYGNPCARELLSGSGYMGLLDASLGVLRRLIRGHKKFVFIPSALEERGFLTLGNALEGGEYAVISTLEQYGEDAVLRWRYGDESGEKALAFVRECCPDVLVGLFRVSNHAPPRPFYAHREQVHLAARVALADGLLRPERGFPMLLDVAAEACRGAFGSEAFLGLVHDAYARAGAGLKYFF